jgi:HEAT repeats
MTDDKQRDDEEAVSMSVTSAYEDNQARDSAVIGLLVDQLASDDRLEREHALRALVAVHCPAVGPLIAALSDPDDEVRWEAAGALAEISDPTAGKALVRALEDPSCDVRWVAGVALIALDGRGLVPLLQALVDRAPSRRLRQGAHHILYSLSSRGWAKRVAPVLSALEDIEPVSTVPLAAQSVLDTLKDYPPGSVPAETAIGGIRS